MKTALIVTLGARDLQLDDSFRKNKELERLSIETIPINHALGIGALKHPRKDGRKIIENFELFKDYVRFPIVMPAIDYILGGYKKIDMVVTAVTDQNDPKFNTRDTVCFGDILEQYLKTYYNDLVGKFVNLTFRDKILDYDFTYKYAGAQLRKKFSDLDEWNVILLPQGGIDSVNTALLLRCIESFKDFYQLSKPEGTDSIIKQSFPGSFRQMLEKQRLLQSINNFNYAAIINFSTSDNYIMLLANYAYYRLGLDYERAWKEIHEFDVVNLSNDKKEFLELLLSDVAMKRGVHDILKLQSDLYAFVKIRWKQGYYADFLMRLFALSENLLIPVINQHFKVVVRYTESDGHKDWNDFINNQPELLAFLKTQEFYGQSLNFSYPNRNAYISIYRFMVQQRQVEEDTVIPDETLITLNTLAALRNKIAHGLHGISREVILRELENRNQDIDKLFEGLDKYFGIEGPDDMGVYSRINERIMSLLY
jgi:hypothetical protein